MNRIIRTLIAAVLLLSMHSVFACDYPPRVSIANGFTATKEEMVQSQRDVKAFVASMEAYLDCMVEEEKTIKNLHPQEEQQREELLNKKYNAAVDEMEKVAAQFNAEVQAYKKQDNS
jgi:DNA repair ATPase RecN